MSFEQLDELMEELESTPDNRERQRLYHLITPLVDLHRDALARVVTILREAGHGDLVDRLAADEVVGTLLRSYEITPAEDLEGRVLQALEVARPLLINHGGNVRLLEMRGKVAVLELTGSCDGCASSLITLKRGIEATLYQLVPELRGVELAGVTTPVAAASARWLPLLYWSDLRNGEWLKVQLFEDELLVCTIDERPFAFRNRCPDGGESLENAEFHHLSIACPTHHHRFDLRTGSCSGQSDLHLDVLPVMVDDNVVKVAV